MTDEMAARYLALAFEHLARGERLVPEQRDRIRNLREHGHDTSRSERFLSVLLTSLDVMRDHHATLEREAAAPIQTRRTSPATGSSRNNAAQATDRPKSVTCARRPRELPQDPPLQVIVNTDRTRWRHCTP